MKGLYLFFFFFILPVFIFSQNHKNVTIGGSISYSHQKIKLNNFFSDENKLITFSFSPRVGLFISEDLEIGFGLGYTERKEEGELDRYGNLFSLNPFLRYYSYIQTNLGFFTEFNFLYGFGKTDFQTIGWDPLFQTTKYDIETFLVSLNPGFIYYFTDHFSVDLSIGLFYYQSDTYKIPGAFSTDPSRTNESSGLNLDLSTVSLGIRFIL